MIAMNGGLKRTLLRSSCCPQQRPHLHHLHTQTRAEA